MRRLRQKRLANIADLDEYPGPSVWGGDDQDLTPLRILERLFVNALGTAQTHDFRHIQRARAAGRISSPDRFDGYFTLQRPAGEAPRELIALAWATFVDSSVTPAHAAAELASVLDDLPEAHRRSFWTRLNDRAVTMVRVGQAQEAERLAAVLPLLAQRLPADFGEGVDGTVYDLAYQIVMALYSGAELDRQARRRERTRATEVHRLHAVADQFTLELVDSLPPPLAARFADQWTGEDRGSRPPGGPELARRVAAAGLDRVARFVESFDNVFKAYHPDEPSDARWLLWHWRALAGRTGNVSEGEPDPRLASYLQRVLDSDPTALSDVLALAGSLVGNRLGSRTKRDEVLASLNEMYHVERLRALTAAAVERSELGAMRWPELVRELLTEVFSEPTPPPDHADPE